MSNYIDSPTPVAREDLINRVEVEGLSYAVQMYYGRNITCTDDPEMDRLWKEAYDAIEALSTYITKVSE